jgi:molecular chaperone HtpG
MRQVLGERIKEVRVSTRLTSAPACLALDAGQVPAYMEALLRANGKKLPESKRVFEINAAHPLIAKLMEKGDAPLVCDAIELLFDQARILEGSSIEDPQKFGERLANVLQASL